MDILEFRSIVKDYFTDNYEEIEVKECDVLKNNGVILRGICLATGENRVLPTIYLNEYLKEYEAGTSLNDIVKRIIRINEEQRFDGEFDPDCFLNYENVKERLFIKLINSNENRDLLDQVPHIAFFDLSMVVYCELYDFCGYNATVLVKDEHVKKWGISNEELFEKAMNNVRSCKVYMKDMMDIVGTKTDDFMKGKMYVMKLDGKTFGASSMILDDVLDGLIAGDCCEDAPEDNKEDSHNMKGVFIIPSSIYEVILVPDSGEYDGETLNKLIHEVNKETLEDTDILSDHAYYYCADEGYSIV